MNIFILISVVLTISISLGLLFEKLLIINVEKLNKNNPKHNKFILNIPKGTFFWSFLLSSTYITTQYLNLTTKELTILNKIFTIVTIIIVTILISKISVNFINSQTKKFSNVLSSTTIFSNITKVIVYIIGTLIILQKLGIAITPILTALGVGGLAVALALQDTLLNLFSGLHILISKQIKPGDYIKLDSGEEGYIEDITWRNTTLKHPLNNLIIIPNSKLASAKITNYNLPSKDVIFSIEITVNYDNDLEKVEQITTEVMKNLTTEVKNNNLSFTPSIRYTNFLQNGITFIVTLCAKDIAEQNLIKHNFIKELHRRYKEENIKIPFTTKIDV